MKELDLEDEDFLGYECINFVSEMKSSGDFENGTLAAGFSREEDGTVWVRYYNETDSSYLNLSDAVMASFGESDECALIPCYESFYLGSIFSESYNEESNTWDGKALEQNDGGDGCWSEYKPNDAMVDFLEIERKKYVMILSKVNRKQQI